MLKDANPKAKVRYLTKKPKRRQDTRKTPPPSKEATPLEAKVLNHPQVEKLISTFDMEVTVRDIKSKVRNAKRWAAENLEENTLYSKLYILTLLHPGYGKGGPYFRDNDKKAEALFDKLRCEIGVLSFVDSHKLWMYTPEGPKKEAGNTKEVEELEEIFGKATLPTTPITLNPGEMITDVERFVTSHLKIIKAHKGRGIAKPHIYRLRKVQEILGL